MFLGNSWLVNSNFTLDDVHRNATLAANLLAFWKKTNGAGLIGLPPTNQFLWLRADSSVFSKLGAKDPSAGPTSANFELIISVRGRLTVDTPKEEKCALTIALRRTTSRRRESHFPPQGGSSPSSLT